MCRQTMACLLASQITSIVSIFYSNKRLYLQASTGRSHYTFKHAQSLERQAEPSYMCTAIVDVNRPRFAPVQR